MSDARRRLLLALRRKVKTARRFDVDYPGGNRIGYTCRTCHVRTEDAIVTPTGEPISDEAVARLAAYQGHEHGGGVSGPCPTCTQHERDRRYPLQ